MLKFVPVLSLCSLFILASCGDDGGSSIGGGSFKKITLGSALAGPGDHGIADVDLKCATGYRALVGSTLERSPNLDWVLKANTEYRRADGVTVIGTTNGSALFTFPLKNSIGSVAGKYYTGIEANWTIDTTKNCDNWGSMADNRTYGDALSVTSTAIAENTNDCGTTGPVSFVVCVEQ